MSRKPKFKPEITRVKLNPEQAVLVCDCFTTGTKIGWTEGVAYSQAILSTSTVCALVKGPWAYFIGGRLDRCAGPVSSSGSS